jgi:hypothetical protein
MRLAGRLALPTSGQETSLGRAKLPLSRRTSLAYAELRSFGCGSAEPARVRLHTILILRK